MYRDAHPHGVWLERALSSPVETTADADQDRDRQVTALGFLMLPLPPKGSR